MITRIKIQNRLVPPEVMQMATAAQLLLYMMQYANTDGLLVTNFSDVCRMLCIDYTQGQKALTFLAERQIICKINEKKKQTVTATEAVTCEADCCENNEINSKTEATPQALVVVEEEKENERESTLPPTPLTLKEKEKEREEIQPIIQTKMKEGENFEVLDFEATAVAEGAKDEVVKTETDVVEEITAEAVAPEVVEAEEVEVEELEPMDTARLEKELEALKRNQVFLEAFAMREKLTLPQVYQALEHFRNECILQGKLSHKSKKDLQGHFICWYRIIKKTKDHGANKYRTREELRRAERNQRMQAYAAYAAQYCE